jgi:long-chain acyl-CoA synthetase
MNFLENIFSRLRSSGSQPVLQEIHGDRPIQTSGSDLLKKIQAGRNFLRSTGVREGDRCALLADNGTDWAAMDLAIIAEGGIVVPLYARQAATELAGMMKDCQPALLICGNALLEREIRTVWPEAPRSMLLQEVLRDRPSDSAFPTEPVTLDDQQPVTIIYTSGTSGEPKGVILSAGNLNHMLGCTTARLDLLTGQSEKTEHVFHYLPFCFAGSWILLLSGLSRNAILSLSTDLSHLVDEMRVASPEYFLNVPILLERMRAKIEEQLRERGGVVHWIFRKARRDWELQHKAGGKGECSLWLQIAGAVVFPVIRKKLGKHLKALICGSAALSRETQLFFMMLGLPVLQVYGLTETTAICTMDNPQAIQPGRVGLAIDGVEMRIGEQDEILVRGPNVFRGYWNRPEETESVLRDGWFHTGDQGTMDRDGYWTISGRLKNLIVLSSGHNIAPEPMEEKLLRLIPAVQQVVLMGSGRSFPSAIITGEPSILDVESALAEINKTLPHYKQIHGFHISAEPISIENGMLTANGKLKRTAITEHFQEVLDSLYREKTS